MMDHETSVWPGERWWRKKKESDTEGAGHGGRGIRTRTRKATDARPKSVQWAEGEDTEVPNQGSEGISNGVGRGERRSGRTPSPGTVGRRGVRGGQRGGTNNRTNNRIHHH